MKKYIILLFVCLLPFFTKAQTANAGAGATIYLTSTSTATLDGSASSGTSYLWSDVSANVGYPMLMKLGVEGHPVNTGTITSDTSKTTTVTGLSQGVWYYQIAVTKGATTHYDTMIVRVDVEPPLAGSILRTLEISNTGLASFLNNRSNTRQMGIYYKSYTTPQGQTYYEMCRSNGAYIDQLGGKFYATVEDGYFWTGGGDYARTEVSLGSGYHIDPAKTYCFEWQGYFPQDFSTLAANLPGVTIWQDHGDLTTGSDGVPFSINFLNGHDGNNQNNGVTGVKGLYFEDAYYPDPNIPYHTFWHLIDLSEMVNKVHTIRIILKEGEVGTGAFIKVEVDGITKYYRNVGKIGASLGTDYPKFAGIYDHAGALVDPNNHTRNRKFAIVTDKFNIYSVTDTTEAGGGGITVPPIDVGSDKTILH